MLASTFAENAILDSTWKVKEVQYWIPLLKLSIMSDSYWLHILKYYNIYLICFHDLETSFFDILLCAWSVLK
jgi:hypothetical protein